MLAIRLSRAGSKNKPFYRVVVSESTRQTRSRITDQIGYFDPRRKPEVIRIDVDKADAWMRRGARPSDTVRRLIDRARGAVA